jgi:predicted ATPase/class 3 adenylate cyclase
MENPDQLEKAIAALEAQRALLGNEVVEAAIGPMREKLAALDAQEAPEQQRKVVSILFMDIAGHTRLIRNLDPEENMDIIDKALVRMTKPVLEFGGHIARYQGDGFKAVFGLPVAQEDDPERTVRAGLAIQAVAQEIAMELETERSMPGFRVRVGIDTGLVVSGGMTEGEDTVKGIPVNLAARLESAAQPGSLLISHNTYRHIRGVFDVQPLDPIQAKGFDQPVPVYQVLRAKPRAFRMSTRGVEGVETRMIGRQAELGQLQEVFDLALREGETQVVTIVGEPGIGKSRLLYEFEQWVELLPEYVRIYRGRAMPGSSGTPFGLLRSLFAFRFNILESDPVDLVRQKLETGLSEYLNSEPLLKSHFIGSMLGYDFRSSPFTAGIGDDAKLFYEQALFYLGQFLTAQAQQNLVLIMLEDIHWADNASLDAVLKLARDQPRLRLMVVYLTRPVLFDSRPHWGQGETSHTRLDLKPLSRRSLRLLVSEILQKVDQLPDEFQEQIVSNAEGNPFYVEELVKILIEDQVIIKDAREDKWHIDMQRLPELHIPVTLMVVLQARLDGLPEAERLALQQAAVVGRIFWDAVIQVLQEAEQPPKQALGGLAQRELIYPREISAFAGTEEFIIKHALLRDVVYESVLKRTRRVYHRKTAEWLVATTQSGGRVDEYAALIAQHYEAADETQAAAEWYLQAGECAQSQSALREALNSFDKVLSLLSLLKDEKEKTQIHLKRGQVLEFMGKWDDAESDYRAALSLSETIQDTRSTARAQRALGSIYRMRGDYPAALDWLERARSKLTGPEGEAELAQVLLEIGKVQERTGNYPLAHQSLESALSLAQQHDDRHLIAKILQDLSSVVSDQGNYEEARSFLNESLVLCRGFGDKRGIAAAINNLGLVATSQGDLPVAQELFEESLALRQEIGDKQGVAAALGNLGRVVSERGDYAESLKHLESGLALYREIGDQRGIMISLINLGVRVQKQGDPTKARTYFEESLSLARELGVPSATATTLMNLGVVAADLDEYDMACKYYEECLTTCREIGDKEMISMTLLNYGYVAYEQKNLPTARHLIQESLTLFQELASRGGIVYALVGLAAVIADTGDFTHSVQLLAVAETLRNAIQLALAPDGSRLYEHALASAHASLGEKAFTAAWAEGQVMTLGQAVAYALEEMG